MEAPLRKASGLTLLVFLATLATGESLPQPHGSWYSYLQASKEIIVSVAKKLVPESVRSPGLYLPLTANAALSTDSVSLGVGVELRPSDFAYATLVLPLQQESNSTTRTLQVSEKVLWLYDELVALVATRVTLFQLEAFLKEVAPDRDNALNEDVFFQISDESTLERARQLNRFLWLEDVYHQRLDELRSAGLLPETGVVELVDALAGLWGGDLASDVPQDMVRQAGDFVDGLFSRDRQLQMALGDKASQLNSLRWVPRLSLGMTSLGAGPGLELQRPTWNGSVSSQFGSWSLEGTASGLGALSPVLALSLHYTGDFELPGFQYNSPAGLSAHTSERLLAQLRNGIRKVAVSNAEIALLRTQNITQEPTKWDRLVLALMQYNEGVGDIRSVNGRLILLDIPRLSFHPW